MGFAVNFIHACHDILYFYPVYMTMIIAFVPLVLKLAYMVLFPTK